MRIALYVALAACSSAPARPVPLPPTTPAAPPAQRYTRIELGTARGHATRTTFELSSSADRIVVLETYEQDHRSLTLADADRDPRWQLAGTHQYRGRRRAACDGCAGFDVELAATDTQPLHLRCEPRTIAVASAGARPAAQVSAACVTGAWDPPEIASVAVLICGAATQDTTGTDPDDQLVFGPGPGIEWIDENDGCTASSAGGLRQARQR
jgi:hypothetical protein